MAWVNKMLLNNFKGVSGLTIDFSEKMTVLIGENGIGKSSIQRLSRRLPY